MNDFVATITKLGENQQIGGLEMQRVKEKAIELLQNGTVDRVLGWRAGEFFYDLTPGCFTSVEEVERDFVYSVFSGANLSKYLIAESRKGGKVRRVPEAVRQLFLRAAFEGAPHPP